MELLTLPRIDAPAYYMKAISISFCHLGIDCFPMKRKPRPKRLGRDGTYLDVFEPGLIILSVILLTPPLPHLISHFLGEREMAEDRPIG